MSPAVNSGRCSNQNAQSANAAARSRRGRKNEGGVSARHTPTTHPSNSPPVGRATATRTRTRGANIATGLRHEGAKHTKIQNLKNLLFFVALWLLVMVGKNCDPVRRG